MSNVIEIQGSAQLQDPRPRVVAEAGGEEVAYSIEVVGYGQLTGLSYTVPAHTSGTITATIQTSALSSDDVKSLNDLAMSMLSASRREEVKNFVETSASASANLSVWTYFFGGAKASASFKATHESMTSMGLTDAQIDKLMDAFMERATKMSTVSINFSINNTNNDYSVSGDLYLYTVSGSVKTSKGTTQYRMLADQGSAGGPPPTGGGAPSTGKIIPVT